jgi:hypothetical protein
MVYTVFSWDLDKAEANWLKHGVSFDDVVLAFDDPHAIFEKDEAHSTPWELREVLLGKAGSRLLFVIFTVREENGRECRIISARCASRRERVFHEETKRLRRIQF